MRQFDVYSSPKTGLHKAIADGVSLPALVFPQLWMLCTFLPRPGFKLYMPFMAGILCQFVLTFLPRYGSLDLPAPIFGSLLIVAMSAHLIGGMQGNVWLAHDLKMKGWTLVASVQADSPFAAIRKAKQSTALTESS